MVSRLLSSPVGPTFHLSLTLLNALSDKELYLALEGAYPPYSYYTLKQYYYPSKCLRTTGISPYVSVRSGTVRHACNARPQLLSDSGLALVSSLAATSTISV